jgi:hypothetical protein
VTWEAGLLSTRGFLQILAEVEVLERAFSCWDAPGESSGAGRAAADTAMSILAGHYFTSYV